MDPRASVASSRAKRDRQVAGKTSLFVTSRETNVISTILRSNLRCTHSFAKGHAPNKPFKYSREKKRVSSNECLLLIAIPRE